MLLTLLLTLPGKWPDREPGRGPVVGRVVQWAPLALLALPMALSGGCSSEPDPVAVVDGIEISAAEFDQLRIDPSDRDEDEQVGDALVLILREAFAAEAESQLGISATVGDIEAAVETQRPVPNQSEARTLLNAELDTLQSLVGTELVTSESDGFDLGAAEQAFLSANAEVCVRQIQFATTDGVTAGLERLAAGEAFADVARELSIDPFVDRAGGVGSGGDLGCSAPGALPTGLVEASLTTPLNRPTGPVTSSVGVHILEVYDRTEPDLTNLHDEVIAEAVPVQGPELFRQWAVAVLQNIDVDIDESVGRWGVLPETEPVPTVVPPYRFDDIVRGR